MLNDNNIGRSRMLAPLPERMRPHNLDGYVGQKHLIGQGCILRNMIDSGNLSSFILWGPPGVGKTTLSRIVAKSLGREFYTLSAVSAGVKDVRDVIDRARSNSIFSNAETKRGRSAHICFTISSLIRNNFSSLASSITI